MGSIVSWIMPTMYEDDVFVDLRHSDNQQCMMTDAQFVATLDSFKYKFPEFRYSLNGAYPEHITDFGGIYAVINNQDQLYNVTIIDSMIPKRRIIEYWSPKETPTFNVHNAGGALFRKILETAKKYKMNFDSNINNTLFTDYSHVYIKPLILAFIYAHIAEQSVDWSDLVRKDYELKKLQKLFELFPFLNST